MRVSQIQNLTWAGNVLVLGGLVWVGLQFWNVNKSSKQKPPEIVWPKAKSSDDVGKQRWPGELAAFKHIWDTPINGKVPPPPPPPGPPVQKIDKVAEFKGKLKYGGGWECPREPDRSLARVSFDGKDYTISPGNSLGGFQLRDFSLDNVKKTARLVFVNPDDGKDVVVEQPQPQGAPLIDPANPPFKPGYGDLVKEGLVGKDFVAKKAFQTTNGEWVIPAEEVVWTENWGEAEMWSKLATRPEVGKDGAPHGLRLLSFPETGTPLAATHGIGQGDVVKAINGVPVNSKEDIMNYLRGDGRGLTKYVVDVERDGATRQVVYLVRRVEHPAHRTRD
jgi:hypothetical protein